MKEKQKLTNNKSEKGIYNKINAFTLIELLAIIVILAIIAVITVPIILNVIENAKKGAAVDSAYGYKDAIEKYYVTKLSKDSDFIMNGDYTIGDKGKLIGDITHEVSFSGTVPSGGYISIENNAVKTACLVIDEYKIELQDGKFVTSGKGECDSEPKVVFGGKVITGNDIPETGHTGVEAIVYLDPTNLATECDENKAALNVKEETGSPTGINSGCMKWYAIDMLSDNDTYTMILDHNTSDSIEWISEDDYKQTASKTATPSGVGISYYSDEVTMTEDGQLPAGTWNSNGTSNRGPITLLKQLQEDTKGWNVAETLTTSNTYTAEWEACGSCSSYYTETQKYTINYNGYKARLISGEEINRIIGKNTNTASDIQYGYLDTNCTSSCSKGTNKYGWLFDHTGVKTNSTAAPSCESNGCNLGLNLDPSGYWTSSPNVESYDSAWNIYYNGDFNHYYGVGVTAGFGVRPVITVSKSTLGIN